jgi:hypothetical protein
MEVKSNTRLGMAQSVVSSTSRWPMNQAIVTNRTPPNTHQGSQSTRYKKNHFQLAGSTSDPCDVKHL